MANIKLMVEGGKASTTPAMAQTLGPLKMDMKAIINDINEKTQSFAGVKVPVEVIVNEKDKTYEIEVGSPPAAELVKKELGLSKASGTPNKSKVANLAVEQLLKISKMKGEGMFVNDIKASMRTVAGSCNSMGILIEGNESSVFNQHLDAGKYDEIIKNDTTEASPEKLKELKEQLAEIQAALEKRFARKQKKSKKDDKEEKKDEENKEEEKKEEEKK